MTIDDIFKKENLNKDNFCYFHPGKRKQERLVKKFKKFNQTKNMMNEIFSPEEMAKILGLKINSKNPKYRKRRVTNIIEIAMLEDFFEKCEAEGLLLTRRSIERDETEKVRAFSKSVLKWVRYTERRIKEGKPVYFSRAVLDFNPKEGERNENYQRKSRSSK